MQCLMHNKKYQLKKRDIPIEIEKLRERDINSRDFIEGDECKSDAEQPINREVIVLTYR